MRASSDKAYPKTAATEILQLCNNQDVEPSTFKSARVEAGLTQQEAAARLGLSQPYYSQLENGTRPVPTRLVNKLVVTLAVSPLAVPLPPLAPDLPPMDPNHLAASLANLGYPGFAHMKKPGVHLNPAALVAGALVHTDLDVRIVEGLPWLLATWHNLNWTWLTAQCKVSNLQNRLGFLLELALQLEKPDSKAVLTAALATLEAALLQNEGTLCYDGMPQPLRHWLREHRPTEAAKWNLLTALTVNELSHAA